MYLCRILLTAYPENFLYHYSLSELHNASRLDWYIKSKDILQYTFEKPGLPNSRDITEQDAELIADYCQRGAPWRTAPNGTPGPLGRLLLTFGWQPYTALTLEQKEVCDVYADAILYRYEQLRFNLVSMWARNMSQAILTDG